MDAEAYQAKRAEREARRKAMREKVDQRTVMVRQSLNRLRSGEGSRMGDLLAQQAKELRDEQRRIAEAGKSVPETGDRGEGQADGGQSENA